MNIGLEGQYWPGPHPYPCPVPADGCGVPLQQVPHGAGYGGLWNLSLLGLALGAWGAWGAWLSLLVGDVLMGKASRAVDPCLPVRPPPASWARPVVSSEFSQPCWPPPRLSLGHTA